MIDEGSNPLENPDVKSLLQEADNINSKHDFHNWQKSFLDAFTRFLDSDGSEKAADAYKKFSNSSGSLFKIVKTLTSHIEQGTLSKERTSVKGRRAITELGTVLNKLVEALQLILPTTSAQITKFGFTKYHMGAVLVEDGFKEYAVMQFCKELLSHLRKQALDEVASQQVLEEIDYFGKKFDVFCGVMESLNLMNVCKIAEKFLHADLTEETNKITEDLAEQTPSPPLPEKKEFTVTVTYPNGRDSPSSTRTTEKEKKAEKVEEPEKSGKKDDDTASSYEEIEEVITVSSYETVEMEDDSSYETLEIVEESEYETDEEVVVVSDYVTDTDDSDAGNKIKKKPKSKKKKGSKPAAKKKPSKDALAPPKTKSSPLVRETQGESASIPRKSPAKSSPPPRQSEGLPPTGHTNGEHQDPGEKNSEEEDDPDSNDSSDSEKKHKGKKSSDVGSDSESSAQGNIKPRAAVAPDSRPGSPTSNEKPVERISFTAKDFYHGHGSNDCFNAWKLYKKDKSEPAEKEEKKLKRVERTETVTTRRKIKDREVKTIHQKKDKPPKVVRVRRTHEVVKKRLVKKEKPEA